MDKNSCETERRETRSLFFRKIINLLTNHHEAVYFNEIVNDLMHAETDAIYWKQKYYGTWPSDGVQELDDLSGRRIQRRQQ